MGQIQNAITGLTGSLVGASIAREAKINRLNTEMQTNTVREAKALEAESIHKQEQGRLKEALSYSENELKTT